MILFADYHIHSNYSDGHNSIEEDVISAVNKGLKVIAITDHNYNHLKGIKKRDPELIFAEIQRLRKIYPIKILYGVEANLISLKGDLDVTPEQLSKLDILIFGCHKLVKPKNFLAFFNFTLPSIFGWLFKCCSKKRIAKNTLAYKLAMDKYPIKILNHLNYSGVKVNVEELAEYAKQKNIWIELNAKRILFTGNEIKNMIKLNTKFVLNSDAHRSNNIGRCAYGFNAVLKYNIPSNLLVNVNKVPKIK